MKIDPKLRSAAKVAGFSLIEVTIAVAITAVALVSLMGMLPKGMQTMSAATDRAIEGRIQQQVVSELMLTEWKNRGIFDQEIRGYDDQGIHIATNGNVFATGRTNADVIYRARIRMQGTSVVLPGGEVDPDLQLVLIDITGLSVSDFNFDSPQNERHIHTYQSTLVDMGQRFGSSGGGGGGGGGGS